MWRKIVHSQSCAIFFRHSAVVGVPAFLLRKLPINKIGRPRSGSPVCLITSMITDRIGRHKFLSPINHNHYNFRENKCIPFFVKEFLIPNTDRVAVSGCKWCDWRIKLSALNMAGWRNCLITANCLISLSDFNPTQ